MGTSRPAAAHARIASRPHATWPHGRLRGSPRMLSSVPRGTSRKLQEQTLMLRQGAAGKGVAQQHARGLRERRNGSAGG
jgi:hypothetical protein